jgi:hypothetical protein
MHIDLIHPLASVHTHSRNQTIMTQDNRGTGRFNIGLYNTTKRAILNAGAPMDVAERAAAVIARDDSNLPNLGRTNKDQAVIWQALTYLIAGGRND